MIIFNANAMRFPGRCRWRAGLPGGRATGFTINTKSTNWIFKSKTLRSRYESLFDAIVSAHQQLRPQVRVTPLERSVLLSQQLGCELYLKCDHLQHTGSFKFRGASNKLRLLDSEQRRRGVIAASTGNHGQAVALAGQLMGVGVTVYAPETAASIKLDTIRALGGTVELVPGDALNAELAGEQAAREQEKPISRRITTSR